MPKKNQPPSPVEIPKPAKRPEIPNLEEPEDPVIPEEDPDIVPDEDPFETPPYEIPPPAEGP